MLSVCTEINLCVISHKRSTVFYLCTYPVQEEFDLHFIESREALRHEYLYFILCNELRLSCLSYDFHISEDSIQRTPNFIFRALAYYVSIFSFLSRRREPTFTFRVDKLTFAVGRQIPINSTNTLNHIFFQLLRRTLGVPNPAHSILPLHGNIEPQIRERERTRTLTFQLNLFTINIQARRLHIGGVMYRHSDVLPFTGLNHRFFAHINPV